MGWTDLFKSRKGPDIKPEPRIRWFGKLPTYADYYTSPADAEWAAEFNEWVLKGYELYHARAVSRTGDGQPKSSDRLPLAGCVLRLPKSGMTVFASIQDYGGDMRGRHFPLCFYAGVPSTSWSASSDCITPAVRVVESLMELREDVMQHFRSPGRFETRFGEREVDLSGFENGTLDASWRQAARTISFEEWFDAVKSVLKVNEIAPWTDAVEQWGRGISAHDSAAFEPTFRFPLAMSMSIDAQITGWVRWLESRMDLSERLLSLMLTNGGAEEVGQFTVIVRSLVPDDFLLVTPMASSISYVDDLSMISAKGESSNHAGHVPKSWAEFVGC